MDIRSSYRNKIKKYIFLLGYEPVSELTDNKPTHDLLAYGDLLLK